MATPTDTSPLERAGGGGGIGTTGRIGKMTPIEQGTDLKTLVTAYERRLILDALEATGGHQRRTARRLGLLPTTLHEKMKRLGLISHTRSEEALSLDQAHLPSTAAHQEGGLALASSY